MLNLNKSHKLESILFFIAVLIHLFPIISLSPFVTLDGPAHLYNSRLIRDLFLSNDTIVSDFFRFNCFPEPNWSGHFFLAALGSFFSPIITEKIFLISIILLLVFGFRNLSNALAPNQYLLSWLIFPWIYNFPFLLGFFNYTIAIGLWFFVLAFWIKNEDDLNKIKITHLILLLIALYFSHLVMLCIALLSIGIWVLFSYDIVNRKTRLLNLVYISIPFLILFCLFIYEKGISGYRSDNARLTLKALIEHYTKTQALIIYNGDLEGIYGKVYSCAMIIFLIVAYCFRSINKFLKSSIILLIVLVALHWIIPDSLASGGIMSIRLAQLIFISLLLVLVCLMPNRKIQFAMASLSLIFSLVFMRYHYSIQSVLSNDAQQYIKAKNYIEKNSIILTLNYSDNWLHSNLSDYLGVYEGYLTLDNYEANTGHFPLLWQENMNPEKYIGDFPASNKPCVKLNSVIPNINRKLDYVVVLNQPENPTDSCSISVKKQLEIYFNKVNFQESNLSIYKAK